MENHHFLWENPLIMVIFNSYVKLPEGILNPPIPTMGPHLILRPGPGPRGCGGLTKFEGQLSGYQLTRLNWSCLDVFSIYMYLRQVRVVRFYVSCLVLLLLSSPPPLVVLLLSLSSSSSCSTATRDPQCSLSDLNHDHPRPVFPAGPQPRPSTPSVPCRTSTTTIHAQCSLPDLNHDHPRPVFPAGPQPRVSPPSVPCRTSTTTIHAQCSLPDLNREYPRQVFPAGPHASEDMPDRMPESVRRYACRYARKNVRRSDRMPEDMPDRMPDRMPEHMPDMR